MKRLLILLLALITLVSMFACGAGDTGTGEPEGGSGAENREPEGTYIYKDNSTLHLVRRNSAVSIKAVTNVLSTIEKTRGTKPALTTDDTDKNAHELVLGEADRAISRKAYRELELLTRVEDGLAGYVIYSNGNSLAVAYSQDSENYAMDLAIEDLITNYLSLSTLELAEGVVSSYIYSATELQQARDDEMLAERWARLESKLKSENGEELAAEIIESLKALYSIYQDGMVTWIANLYDPEIGGFYYSNSARDNIGYLPDIESTQGALAFLDSTGMTSECGGKYELVIPEQIKNKIGEFVLSLQDPVDGYFYHPQWGKNITASRQGRDLGSCITVLRRLGFTPKYKLPTDTSSASASSYLTPQIRDTGATIAVSKIQLAASLDNAPTRFKSEQNYREYLAGLNLATDSYRIGNELQASVSQINAYGKLLGVDLMDITIDWLDEHQNPDTGLWHYEIGYYASNSLHKIFSVYNSAGRAIPNVEKSIEAAIASITSDEPISAGVDIYNAWSVIPYAFSNIRKYNTSATEVIETVLATLRENAPDMIDVSREKILPLRKEDGSFSYGVKYSSATSQGAPAAVPGSIEGDVNGNSIACTALVTQIFGALDIGNIIPIYTESDLKVFLDIISSCSPINKGFDDEKIMLDFDDDSIGSYPVILGVVDSTLGGSGVIADPRQGATGNVYKHVHKTTLADTLTVNNKNDYTTASVLVFEGDLCVESTTGGYIMQIMMGSAFHITLRTSEDRVKLVVASTTSASTSLDEDLGVSAKIGEWFNLKIVHYVGDHDTVRTVIYFNGEAVAVTDNYYLKPREGRAEPSNVYNSTTLHFMKSPETTMMFDNLSSYCDNGLYTPIKLSNDAYINVDKDKLD